MIELTIALSVFGLWTLIMALYLGWRWVSYQLKLRAAIRAQVERDKLAEADYLESMKWRGSDQPGADDPELEAKIRIALQKRRNNV